MYYTPLELQKVCCNIVIKQIYNENENTFLYNLKNIGLPNIINDSVIDRYKIIKLILNN